MYAVFDETIGVNSAITANILLENFCPTVIYIAKHSHLQ